MFKNPKNPKHALAAAATALGFTAASVTAASAETIKFTFDSIVSHVASGSAFSVGQEIKGLFSYDTEADTAVATFSSLDGSVFDTENYVGSEIYTGLGIGNTLHFVNESGDVQDRFVLRDATATADTSSTKSFINSGDISIFPFSFGSDAERDSASGSGYISTVAAVPLGSAGVMLLSAFGGLGIVASRRRSPK